MGKQWTDRGNGQWKLVITDDANGLILSTYYGTKDEIADKQADSLASAGRRINELRNGNGQANAPRPLSATERLQTVSELNDPATVDRAITRVVESVVGPVDQLRQNTEQDRQERYER